MSGINLIVSRNAAGGCATSGTLFFAVALVFLMLSRSIWTENSDPFLLPQTNNLTMDDPKVIEKIAKLRLGQKFGEEETEAKQLLQVKDDHAFIWNSLDSLLLVISLRKDLPQTEERVQTFRLTDTPNFEVEQVVISALGRVLCLFGRRGVACVELPRRSGKNGRFGGGEADVTCRSFGVAERTFTCLSKIVVQQAQFHPGSVLENHLVVLASDNRLRVFNLDEDLQNPEQVISLSPSAKATSKFFGESALSLRGSLGEVAVGFSFAPPVPLNGEEDLSGQVWPVFVLNGNGEIFCLLTSLTPGQKPDGCDRVIGPLTMYPEAADNYGVDSCALLCLHPMISSPPLLVIASSGGTLYHCVVLNKSDVEKDDDEDEDAHSQFSQWSNSTFFQEDPKLGLYVYESVELEIGLTTQPGREKLNEQRPFDYPMLLHVDPTSPARYFCSHKAGVHCIGLPMVTQLAEMAQRPQDAVPDVEQESIVEHLICTQMSSGSKPAPVLGVAVHYPPTNLVCLLSDCRIQSLNLAAPYFDSPPPLLSKTPVEAGYQSPLKNKGQSSKEPFDQRIKMILKKGTTLPLMKGGANAEVNGQDCLDIMTRSTQILREEYILRFDVARAEIERRVNYLTNTRQSQIQALAKLNQAKNCLRDKAADTSERYEDLKDNGDKLQSRIDVVLQKIQRQLPGLTDSELKMQRQLKDLQRKSKDLANALEQIRSKENYQMQQIDLARNNTKSSTEVSTQMGQNQLNSIKEVLQNDSRDIAEMVKKLNLVRKDLSS